MTDTYSELSAEQVDAIRKANDVSFHHRDGRGFIRLRFRRPATGGLQSQEWATEFDVGSILGSQYRIAFAYIGSAQFAPEWMTVARQLHVGDSILLRWEADYHSNQYVKDAGLHADVLRLRVMRKKGRSNRRQVDEYELASQICPDNSARMVRA